MRRFRSRRGFTLIEIITATGIMLFMVTGMMSIMLSSLKAFDSSTVQTYTDADAVNAMQKIVTEVREAKQVETLDNQTRMVVTMPYDIDHSTSYDKTQTDPVQIQYYLSDASGTVGKKGTILWMCSTNGRPEPIKRNVVSVLFQTRNDIKCQVEITIDCENASAKGPVRTELTERVVYLRNY